jgi:hypothetical protein
MLFSLLAGNFLTINTRPYTGIGYHIIYLFCRSWFISLHPTDAMYILDGNDSANTAVQ